MKQKADLVCIDTFGHEAILDSYVKGRKIDDRRPHSR